MMLELAPHAGELGVLEREYRLVIDEYHAMRVAHRDRGYPPGAAANFQRIVDDAAVRGDRDFAPFEDRLAHVDGRLTDASAVQLKRDGLEPAVGFDDDAVLRI